MSSGSFSVGYDFDYWSPDKDLYVARKYDNLKDEILNCKYLDVNDYYNQILPKSQYYQKTNITKSIKVPECGDIYGFREGDIVSICHLQSIILYCDYDLLSSKFSGTLRKNGPFETIKNIIKRHKKYYWFARLLKETVKVFGQYNGDWGSNGLLPALNGPFFCGMSVLMTMPCYSIKLYSATSTSINKEVAMMFAGNNGLIIQFDNKQGDAKFVRAFDVSWISRFGGAENERYNRYSLFIQQYILQHNLESQYTVYFSVIVILLTLSQSI